MPLSDKQPKKRGPGKTAARAAANASGLKKGTDARKAFKRAVRLATRSAKASGSRAKQAGKQAAKASGLAKGTKAYKQVRRATREAVRSRRAAKEMKKNPRSGYSK